MAERPDGTRVPFMPYPTPMRDAAGKIIGAVNMLVDLTERVNAEQIAQHLASIVESSDDAIVEQDRSMASSPAGTAEPSACSATRPTTSSASLSRSSFRRSVATKNLEFSPASGAASASTTTRPFAGARTAAFVEISLTVSPVRDAQGRIVGASKIARDITERRQAEAQQLLLTREMHHRTQNIFSVVQAVISKSFAGKRTVEEARASVLDRLHSLARTHALLVEQGMAGKRSAGSGSQRSAPVHRSGAS